MEPIIIDNFLPDTFHKEIYATLTSREFTWHLQKSINYGGDPIIEKFKENDNDIVETSGFAHRFYFDKEKLSSYCDFVRPVLYFVDERTDLNVNGIERMRAVYIPRDKNLENKYGPPHIDYGDDHMVLIYYLNNSDGGTYLFDRTYDKKILDPSKFNIKHYIEPKENRAVIFNGLTYHSGKIPASQDKVLLNFNFTV